MADVTPVVCDVTDPPSMDLRRDIQELRSLKREMDARGSLLGRTWSELSGIMDKYQARLLEKHDQVEFKAVPVDHQKYETLEKRVSDLEQKLLAKDSEIVELRTAVHQYKNEVRMKDNLIEKIQNQMAREAMEFQTEISSLRDMLERRENGGGDANIGATAGLVKRRKINANKPVSQAPESSTSVSQPSPSLRLSKPVFPGPEPVFTDSSPTYNNQNFRNFDNTNSQLNDSKNQNFENQNFEIENLEEEEEFAERVGVKLEETDDVPEEVYAGLEQAEDEIMLQQVLDTGQGSSGQFPIRQSPHSIPALPPPLFARPPTLPALPAPVSATFIPESPYASGDFSDGYDPEYDHSADMRSSLDVFARYQCHICQKLFRGKSQLRNHVNFHLGIKPYMCKLCQHRCTQKGNLEKHLIMKHNDEVLDGNWRQFVECVKTPDSLML